MSNITKEEAIRLLKEARSIENSYKLFEQASKLRNNATGNKLWWTSGSGGIFPCNIMPRCSYCSFYSENKFKVDSLLKAINIIEKLGIKQFHISGGTDLVKGYDNEILNMVSKIQEESNIELEINLGPSFKKETILELKKMGVQSITSSLECNNADIFREAKPGDSLTRRRELLHMCDEAEMPTRTMMLIGLGESDEDRIEHLFYLKDIKHLYQIRLSRFMPFPNTSFKNRQRCSPWEVALTTAIARLINPSLEISLAAGNSNDDIPLWYLAGGGNQVMGVSISKNRPKDTKGVKIIPVKEDLFVIDRRDSISEILSGMNKSAVNDIKASI